MRILPYPATVISLVLLTLGAAMALRYRVVEPASVGLLCDPGTGPWWCQLRAAVVMLFGSGALGLLSLATGILSHFLDWRGMAVLALAAGAAGLVLYNADTAAVGFVVGLLRAVRR